MIEIALGLALLSQVDLATTPATPSRMTRVYGSVGDGRFGLPVAGGPDIDGDGFTDLAKASMLAGPMGRTEAGTVFLVFGDGTIGGFIDTSQSSPRVLPIHGAAAYEHAGSEVWIDDVTGDGLGELLLCRQDYSAGPGRVGVGALTILGGSWLRDLATQGQPLDLASLPGNATAFTLIGAEQQDRLCMWARTGDVTGDAIADIVVGADQAGPAADHIGTAYVIRGGAHLANTEVVDLGNFGDVGSPLPGDLLQLVNPRGIAHWHFGATVQVADLDANGQSEVLVAAGVTRAGGSLRPGNPAPEVAHGSGGTTDPISRAAEGSVFIFWDNHFQGVWPAGHQIELDSVPQWQTEIIGGAVNQRFGEEMLGGDDYDGDGSVDLFVGDLVGGPPGRGAAGVGHVLYSVAEHKGAVIDLDSPPPGLSQTIFYGPIVGAIAADTAMQGDFDGDGHADLVFSSPHAAPFGRRNAGTIHVFYGSDERWPGVIDLASTPADLEVHGGKGNQAGNTGDTLSYSGAAADLDGNGIADIVTNEMVGDGLAPGTVDVGNLLVIGQGILARPLFCDGFEDP